MTPEPPTSHLQHRVHNAAFWLIVVAVLVVAWPARWGGWASFTVVSGTSMEPTLHTGDVVVAWRSGSYDPDDVVVYRVPDGQPGEGHHVIHRVTANTDGTLTTQGDNKKSVDPWTPTPRDVVGEQLFTIAKGHRILAALPWALSLVTGALITCALWPRRPADEPDAATDSAPGAGGTPAHAVHTIVAVALGAVALVAAGIGADATGFGGMDVDAVEISGPSIGVPPGP